MATATRSRAWTAFGAAMALLAGGCAAASGQSFVRQPDPTFRVGEWSDVQLAEQVAPELGVGETDDGSVRQERETLDGALRSHGFDAVVLIVAGRGQLLVGCNRIPVTPGTVVGVPAGVAYGALGGRDGAALQGLLVMRGDGVNEPNTRAWAAPRAIRRTASLLGDATQLEAVCTKAHES
jgi:hypothetical protein